MIAGSGEEAGKTAGVVIAAAGRGESMGGVGGNKLLRELEGLPVILWTIRSFQACPKVKEIVVAAEPSLIFEFKAVVESDSTLTKPTKLIKGGSLRQDSVRAGLAALKESFPLVLIHDGDRPFVPPALIEAVLAAVPDEGGAIAAVSALDTIKIAGGEGEVLETVDRRRVWLAQTPQAFSFPAILELHRRAGLEGWEVTDDASLVEKAGGKIKIVEGDYYNIKITSPSDWRLAEFIARERRG